MADYKFVAELENCTIDYSEPTISNGDHTFTITPNVGYELTEKGSYTKTDPNDNYDPVTEDFVPSSKEVATLTINVYKRDITIRLKATKKVEGYKFTTELENCTIDYSEPTISNGDHTFTITPNVGYELTEKGSYTLADPQDYYAPVDTDFFPSSKEVTTLTINIRNKDLTIRLKATKKQVEQISNFTLLYKTNDNELGQLSVERFNNKDGVDKDYGSNILKLYKLPFDVDVETVSSKIKWGNVESSVLSNKLTRSRFTLDLGTITVPEKYGNAFDYKNGEVEIFLPFIDSITTDLKTVMNKTLNFSLTVNLYSGQATVNISSNGDMVFSKDTNISMDIPFIQSTTGSNFNTLKTYLINDIRKVKLVITRQIPKGSVFSSSDRMLGSAIHGYIEGKIISSNYENMLSLDVDELQNKIRSGVKFK